MTANEQIEKLRSDFLKDIKLHFSEYNLNEITFNTEDDCDGLNPYMLDKYMNLTVIDEFGNDQDMNLTNCNIDIVSHILTLIQTNKYEKV